MMPHFAWIPAFAGMTDKWGSSLALAALAVTFALLAPRGLRAEIAPLRVFATTADLGSLTQAVGGDAVAVTVMAKGSEDAHFVEAKPSFIKQLSQSDLYIQTGMDLELGYAPLLLQNARNAQVLPGSPGYLDAAAAIVPLGVPAAPVDRSMGDVHPFGNPHYLLDPINGMRVARSIADRLATLRPELKTRVESGYAALRDDINMALVGASLAQKYDVEKLALLFERGALGTFLQQQGDAGALGGWLGKLLPYYGTKVVDDHPLWPYFARRFGLQIVGHLEPKPGIQPTTSHLTELIQQMKAQHVPAILAAPYYDPRHASFVANATGATVVYLAHQVGGREGTGDYVRMIDYHVTQRAAARAARAAGNP
jgi:ABC-type Zn uptake system ZnuABC Zn-binding protein ZnuA